MYIRIDDNTIIEVTVIQGDKIDLDLYAVDNPNYIKTKDWQKAIEKIINPPKPRGVRGVIDKTKKSNIKCEHCEFAIDGTCLNSLSPKYNSPINYWNRCKGFKWKE